MQVLKSILYGLLLCCSCWASAQDYDFFVERNDDTEHLFDAAYPKITTEYSVLHNLFFKMIVGKFTIILLIKPISSAIKC